MQEIWTQITRKKEREKSYLSALSKTVPLPKETFHDEYGFYRTFFLLSLFLVYQSVRGKKKENQSVQSRNTECANKQWLETVILCAFAADTSPP